MNIIADNPYRLLGVLSNASMKEIVANQGKIKAFIKTKKPIVFDYDFSAILPPIERNSETISKAINSITLFKDKLVAGSFWFINKSELDEIALNHLVKGDIEAAITILRKKTTVSACINLAVIYLIKQDWTAAIYYYSYLFLSSDRIKELVTLIADNPGEMTDEEIINLFTEKLINSYPNVGWIECMNKSEVVLQGKPYPIKNFLYTSNVYKSICKYGTAKYEKDLEEYIKTASSVSSNEPIACLNAAKTLELKAKVPLRDLRLSLGKDSKKYIDMADKVANTILNNCIDYYNHSKDDEYRSKKIIKLIRFSFRTAEGKIAKDRCQNNLQVIKKEYDSLTPNDIENEIKSINIQISTFNNNHSLSHLDEIIGKCFNELQNIRIKVGEDSKHYIKASSRIVSFSLTAINDIIDYYVKKYKEAPEFCNGKELMSLRMNLRACQSILLHINSLKKDTGSQELYNNTWSKYQKLYKAYYIESFSQNILKKSTRTTSSSTSDNKTTKYHIDIPSTDKYDTPQYSYTTAPMDKNDQQEVNILKWFKNVICIFILILPLLVLCESKKNESSSNNTSSSKTAEEINSHAIQQSQQESWLQTYKGFSLSNGSTPYYSLYGENLYGGTSSLTVRAPESSDVIVIIKNSSGRVVNHAYVASGQFYTFSLIPGIYQPFFIFGNSWCPEKEAPNGAQGYFLENISISKDYPQEIKDYQSLEYTLQRVRNGNFHAKSSNSTEAF